MNKNMFLALSFGSVLGVAVASLSVPASFAMSGRPSSELKGPVDRNRCFDPTFVRSFQTTDDDRKIIIISDSNQAYELQTEGGCVGLDMSLAIGIRSRTGMSEVCGAFDADIVFSEFGHERRQACQVIGVRHLMGEDAEKYLGKKAVKKDEKAAMGPNP